MLFGQQNSLPSFLARHYIPGLDVVVSPCAVVLVFVVSGLLCVGIKESTLVEGVVTVRSKCMCHDFRQGIGVSQSTYASVFRACAGLSALSLGSQLHGHTIKTDFGSDTIVATATLDMYSKCNSLTTAQYDTQP